MKQLRTENIFLRHGTDIEKTIESAKFYSDNLDGSTEEVIEMRLLCANNFGNPN